MKKLLLILLCLPMIGFGQKTYIPNNVFEKTLVLGGWDNVMDDSVLTSSIDTITILDIYHQYTDANGQSFILDDITGINDFISLEMLFLNDSQFSTINISNLTQLKYLVMTQQKFLTSLDVSNNILLEHLELGGQQYSPPLSSGITTLDLSCNINLRFLHINNGYLTQLNLKNGNNHNISFNSMITTGNPNLTCIQTDETNANYHSGWGKDPQQFYSLNCGYSNCNVNTEIQEHTTNKELLKVTDLLGRETKQTNQPLFYIYDDGTVEKRITID